MGMTEFTSTKESKRTERGKERESIVMTAKRINNSYFNPMNLLHSSKQAGLTFLHDNDSHNS